jgi:hypothetical protein
MENTNELLPDEYPARYCSTKYDGTYIDVYRVTGKYGLVYYANINANPNKGYYVWKYFTSPIKMREWYKDEQDSQTLTQK